MNTKVRDYLEKIVITNAEMQKAENELNIHKDLLEKDIEALKKEYDKKINPLLSEISEKKRERSIYKDAIKGQLKVNGFELLKEIDKRAQLKGIDQARLIVDIAAQGGFLTMDDIKKKVERGSLDFVNAFRLTIKNLEYTHYRKFMYCKSIDLDSNIEFSDGSSIFDNLVVTPHIDNFNRKVTRLGLTDEGLSKLMITFTPEDLINNGFLFKPVDLLRESVLNILEKQNPTM